MCDAVLERSDSAAVLARLERANFLVTRLEQGRWYRIHSLFAEFAGFELAAIDPGAERVLNRRAAEWLYAQRRPVEAAEHAARAGEYELVARLLAEHHLVLIRTGGARTLLQWVREIPDEQLLEYPSLIVAAATATTMLGQSTIERRRLLGLAARSKGQVPRPLRTVRGSQRRDGARGRGRRRRRRRRCSRDGVPSNLPKRSPMTLWSHPSVRTRTRSTSRAGSTTPGRPPSGRSSIRRPSAGRRATRSPARRSRWWQPSKAAWRRLASTPRKPGRSSRASVVGAAGSAHTPSAALGLVLAGEGRLSDAERELASALHLFRDEVATLHQAWVQLQLARVRCRRGRLDEAEAAARSAREAMDELPACSSLSALAREVESELAEETIRAESGKLLTAPSEAELVVLRLLDSDLSVTTIAKNLYLSPNTVRSHTRALYRKLGVNTRAGAVARPRRSDCWSKRNHACDRGHMGCATSRIRAMLALDAQSAVPAHARRGAQRPSGDRVRRSDPHAGAGTTVLRGTVRDQAELQGLFQRIMDLGLTLVSATSVRDATED